MNVLSRQAYACWTSEIHRRLGDTSAAGPGRRPATGTKSASLIIQDTPISTDLITGAGCCQPVPALTWSVATSSSQPDPGRDVARAHPSTC